MKARVNPQFRLGKALGRGYTGEVCETTITDPMAVNDPTVNNKSFVLKTVQSRFFNDKEVEIQSRYNTTFKPNHSKSHSSWLTARIEGVYFSRGNTKDLPLAEKLRLIFEFASRLNLHHHNTPATGSAVVHGDIKCLNVLFKESIDLVDYGLSFDIEDDPNLVVEHPTLKFSLNPLYFPREALKGKFGIKTDIYMAAYMISGVLATSSKLPKDLLPNDIQIVLAKFLERCVGEYENRPDSDQFLKFFTSLYLYHKAHLSLEDMEEEKDKYWLTMQLLAINCWDEKERWIITPTLRPAIQYLIHYKLDNDIKDLKNDGLLQSAVINLAENQPSKFTEYYPLLKENQLLQNEVVNNNFENLNKIFVIKLLENYISQRKSRQQKETGCFYSIKHFFLTTFTNKDAETKLRAAGKMLSRIKDDYTPRFSPQEFEALTGDTLGEIYKVAISVLPQNKLTKSSRFPFFEFSAEISKSKKKEQTCRIF